MCQSFQSLTGVYLSMTSFPTLFILVFLFTFFDHSCGSSFVPIAVAAMLFFLCVRTVTTMSANSLACDHGYLHGGCWCVRRSSLRHWYILGSRFGQGDPVHQLIVQVFLICLMRT